MQSKKRSTFSKTSSKEQENSLVWVFTSEFDDRRPIGNFQAHLQPVKCFDDLAVMNVFATLFCSPLQLFATLPLLDRRILTREAGSLMSLLVGEALVGEGNEIAHIDLMIGSKNGPVGNAFANALATQSAGHTNLLAVLTPNLAVKPSTVMITKVTIKGMKQAVQMFGPAQAAVAKAVADQVQAGVIPQDQCEDLVIVCGVFIAPTAEDNAKIYQYNYEATKLAIASAMRGSPSAAEMIAQKDTASHPFKGFDN